MKIKRSNGKKKFNEAKKAGLFRSINWYSNSGLMRLKRPKLLLKENKIYIHLKHDNQWLLLKNMSINSTTQVKWISWNIQTTTKEVDKLNSRICTKKLKLPSQNNFTGEFYKNLRMK